MMALDLDLSGLREQLAMANMVPGQSTPVVDNAMSGNVPQTLSVPGIVPTTNKAIAPTEGGGIWDKIKGVVSKDKLPMVGMLLSQYGAAMSAPPEQRGAILARIPGNIALIKVAQEKAKRDAEKAKRDELAQQLAVKKLFAPKYASQWFTDEQGNYKQLEEGQPSPPGWVPYTKPAAEKDLRPITREVKRGGEIVTEEFDRATKTWNEVSRAARWNPKEPTGPAVDVTLPDGTRITAGTGSKGGATSQSGLTPKTQGEVEKGLLDVTEGLADTHRIQKAYDPSFATIGGQWAGYTNRIKDKLGYQLNPEEQKQFEGFSGYRAEAGRVFANTLKKLSGTAVTEPEMKRQEVYLINPGTGVFDGDSPAQVKTKIDKFLSFQRNSIARLNYIRKNGLSIRNAAGDKDFANISLDRVPGIIKGYGQKLSDQLQKQNNWAPNDPRLIQEVQAGVAEYFGLVQ
jgi:hypothetical protein